MTSVLDSAKSEEPVVAHETCPCPLGCAPNDAPLLTGRDRLLKLPGTFQVVQCRTCGLARTNPRPTPDAIGFYYPADYSPYGSTQVTARSGAGGRAPTWKRLAKRALDFNINRLPPLPPGRALEVGCASGAFLSRMAREGWDVEGIEYSPDAAELARKAGFRVHTGSLETAPDPDRLFDLAVGWMVMEHLHDPVLALQKLHRWVRPGGWLAVSVPNAASQEARLFGTDWYALDLPRHLYHFTPATMAKILERGGWRMERVYHQKVLGNLIASVGYALEGRPGLEKLSKTLQMFPRRATYKHYALLPLAQALSLIGQTGRMTVWARRTDD